MKERLWKIFKELGEKALVMNHYELAKATEVGTSEDWKNFLLEQDVADYINAEMNLLRSTELNKMLKDISSSHSVGQAQLMNALTKLAEQSNGKEGPVFIYTYVPLSAEQEQAENVVKETEDIFLRRG